MSSYMIKVVLSNPRHPEYGQITIPFPIPNEEYDHSMELLKTLELGDVLQRDCQVDELDSYYGVLKRLESQRVNVDELDYLAKRLESFCVGEDAQFQGMAVRLDVSDIIDFINLTFCCQQATVITDFSDLKKVGQAHYMNLHGGCASTRELDNLDGYETALLLIDSGAGQVTPYGVVYDNGMKLETLYDGRHFSGYLYEPPVLALEATSIHGKVTGVLCLPASDQQLQRLRLRAEVDSPDTWLRVSMDELPEKVAEALDLEHLSGDDIPALNRLCRAIGPMREADMEKLNAVVLLADTSGIYPLCQLAENLDQFDFVPGIHTPEEYGKYIIRESGHFEYDENLEGFYDYRLYGEQRIKEEGGQFNECGYVAYRGTLSLEELIRQDPAAQCQREQGQQMM